MSPGLRRLYVPRRVAVEMGAKGEPRAVEGIAVEAVREEWLIEDRWWTPRPLRRHYYELVLTDGRDVVVFRATSGRWYRQRA
ncbi:MAG TPA: hypothetical protein VN752_04345 [Solirubrobacterales bacterium]|nr:hypothetical protein [Solirubrobacterales bacterium]